MLSDKSSTTEYCNKWYIINMHQGAAVDSLATYLLPMRGSTLHGNWVRQQHCCCCWVPEMVIMSSLACTDWSKQQALAIARWKTLHACGPPVQFGRTDRQTDRICSASVNKCCHRAKAQQTNTQRVQSRTGRL